MSSSRLHGDWLGRRCGEVPCGFLFPYLFLPVCDDTEKSCLGKQAKLVEEGLRNSLVMEEGGRADFGRLVAFALALGGDGGADFGEGSYDVVRRVGEGGAGVADGDDDELDASPLFAEGCEEGGSTCRSSVCISHGSRGPCRS